MENEIVILLAGNHTQAQHWIRNKIIVLTSKQDLHRLEGCKISAVYTEGTYLDWLDEESKTVINARYIS